MSGVYSSGVRLATFEFAVEPFHVDFTRSVSLGEMAGYIMFCAAQHAEHLGCGLRSLLSRDLSWFLTRAVIELERYPMQFERIRIETWVEQTNRLFSIRNMDFFDEQGVRFGGARLMWALVDMTTHTPVELTKVLPEMVDFALERATPLPKPCKVPELGAAVAPVRTHDVAYSDIDINRHFNSVKYIERLGDLFDLEMYRESYVSRLEINYAAEALFGMKLQLCCESSATDPNVWVTCMRHADTGETLCRARFTWTKREK